MQILVKTILARHAPSAHADYSQGDPLLAFAEAFPLVDPTPAIPGIGPVAHAAKAPAKFVDLMRNSLKKLNSRIELASPGVPSASLGVPLPSPWRRRGFPRRSSCFRRIIDGA
jgi:hypothetical protein